MDWSQAAGYPPRAMVTLAFGIEPSNRKYRLRLARYRYLADALGEFLPLGTSVVLDAGCGKGRLGLYWGRLARPGRTARIIGVDISPARLDMARERGYHLLLRADLLRRWPFPDRSFDAVVCEQVLEHFGTQEVRFLLSEISRLLKPNAVALVGTPVFSRLALSLAPIWKRLNPIIRRWRGATPPQHLQHFRIREVEKLLLEHGLVPERARGFRLFSLPGSFLENSEWYYRLHRWLGARLPGLTNEVNIAARRVER